MRTIFRAQLEITRQWLAARPKLLTLEVAHSELIAHPAAVAREIAAFLGGNLDIEAMAAAVDPALYRNRAPLK